ncbi:uncharacterized protein TNCV_3563711 [Trichonephila clavipes]|nr:uncharacterized protein TNCV_3563711 [Trichonephila clavipes]
MNRVSRHVHLLHVLADASPAQRKAILKSATDDRIQTLCEICDNLLSGNIPTKKIKKLCGYKRVIRLLANRSVPISRKRKLFTTNRQVGGFLPLILPGVLSLLGGIAGKAICKRIRNMAQEMGLVPKGLISRYFAETQPEVQIENNISSLLHEKETPDDIKAKLLSYLIPKYQRVMQPPPPLKPFEIPPELLTEPKLPLTNKPEVPLRINILAKYIGYAISKTRKKYILPILGTLKNANYTFNDKNEFEVDSKPEYCSNVVDLYSYMMKNDQRVLTPPTGFAKFYASLRHVNIPMEWIGNKRLREQLLLSDANPAFTKITPSSLEIKKWKNWTD